MARRIVFVIGTRAQLIKVAPVVVECERRRLPCTLLMTGQHQETMQDLLDEFAIHAPQAQALPASEHASVGSLVRWLPAAYRGVARHLRAIVHESDDVDVLVHGDTLSTLVGAFAGRRARGRVVHLESGLTSGNLFDPFPEEFCRRLVFRMTDLAMCPNAAAVHNMQRYRARVIDTGGNTIIDAVALTGAGEVAVHGGQGYAVVSLHRFQNIYSRARLAELVDVMLTLAHERPLHFVLHPATRNRLLKFGFMQRLADNGNVHLMARMGYGQFLRLAAGADFVLTDGGSNQEELAALGVPTVVMRARTERPDGLGANAIMERDIPNGLCAWVAERRFLGLRHAPAARLAPSPSERIVDSLLGEAIQPSR